MNQKVQEIKTGIKEVDSLFKGLKQNSIIVIGGHTLDDSAFLFNLLADLCVYKKKCLYCSSNFQKEELVRVLTNIELYQNDNYKMTIDGIFKDYVSLKIKSLTDIFQWNIDTFNTDMVELSLMEDKLKELSPDFVLIDTISELEVPTCKEYVSQFIKEMVKKYNTCFFINTFEKENAYKKKQLTISDIEASANLIELADDVIIIDTEEFDAPMNVTSVKRLNRTITIPYKTSII